MGIRLNQFGEVFLRHSDQIFRELTAAMDEIQGLAGLDQGIVTMAASALHWPPDVLRPFRAAVVLCQDKP